MEIRELRAFVVAARELHFGRAAGRLFVSPSSMSETIRRLEVELDAPLFVRTTRQISLTDAGAELLQRAEQILSLIDQAALAIPAIARGSTGRIVVGVTPPAATVLAPHLAQQFAASSPEVTVEIQRMWLPNLGSALRAGTIDAAITCGTLPADSADITTVELGSERLLIGLRPGHPLAGESTIDLLGLADRTLGMHPARLFPAWHAAQRQVLDRVGVAPPVAELRDVDLSARRWTDQPEIDWIMVLGSFLSSIPDQTVVRPALLRYSVPFTISWNAEKAGGSALARFVQSSLAAPVPAGWVSESARERPARPPSSSA